MISRAVGAYSLTHTTSGVARGWYELGRWPHNLWSTGWHAHFLSIGVETGNEGGKRGEMCVFIGKFEKNSPGKWKHGWMGKDNRNSTVSITRRRTRTIPRFPVKINLEPLSIGKLKLGNEKQLG